MIEIDCGIIDVIKGLVKESKKVLKETIWDQLPGAGAIDAFCDPSKDQQVSATISIGKPRFSEAGSVFQFTELIFCVAVSKALMALISIERIPLLKLEQTTIKHGLISISFLRALHLCSRYV